MAANATTRPLEPYLISFQADGTVTLLTQEETVDLASVTTYGTGTLTYARNGTAITGETSFAAGDRFAVTATGTSGELVVNIPRSRQIAPSDTPLFAERWYEPISADELRKEILNLYGVVRGDTEAVVDPEPTAPDETPDPPSTDPLVLYGTDTAIYGTETVIYG